MNVSKPICANCGQSLESDDVFCGECGHRVSSTRTETTQPEHAEKAQQASISNHMPPPRPVRPQATSEKPRRKLKKPWLAATILASLLLVAVAVVFSLNESSDTVSIQQASELDDWILSQIKITNVDTFYEQNVSVGKIFVVTGNAINQSASPIRFIRLEVSLYGPDGEFLSRQSAYAGNVVDRTQLKSLPLHSIKLMMHTPYRRNTDEILAVGGILPFMIVFADLPETGKLGYDIRVISVDFD